ncbi:hypothetical protein [Rufibacter quisquiliarum]|uniref:Uncharacterized protein n=1 Tax=Rufibacter quisquiliarum TaxID=1549639 RepID=A0A839GU54_9BACT|nr:hypothetical protein [Rufibacter quisquiliarum]MBA9078326.1 hypothetical protein [Rufibacter quisquiliarum]
METAKWILIEDDEPNYNGAHYLVIVFQLGVYSYALRYFNNEGEWEKEFEEEQIVAFTETDPKKIIDALK